MIVVLSHPASSCCLVTVVLVASHPNQSSKDIYDIDMTWLSRRYIWIFQSLSNPHATQNSEHLQPLKDPGKIFFHTYTSTNMAKKKLHYPQPITTTNHQSPPITGNNNGSSCRTHLFPGTGAWVGMQWQTSHEAPVSWVGSCGWLVKVGCAVMGVVAAAAAAAFFTVSFCFVRKFRC